MKKEIGTEGALSVPCPTCGVSPGEQCKLASGEPRNNPHRDRRLNARDSTAPRAD
jgi:hypothetical protein